MEYKYIYAANKTALTDFHKGAQRSLELKNCDEFERF